MNVGDRLGALWVNSTRLKSFPRCKEVGQFHARFGRPLQDPVLEDSGRLRRHTCTTGELFSLGSAQFRLDVSFMHPLSSLSKNFPAERPQSELHSTSSHFATGRERGDRTRENREPVVFGQLKDKLKGLNDE